VYLNAWLRNEGLLHFLNDPPASFEDIDPERTKAFVLDPGRVYVNQKGTMPAGSVASGQEYERVLKILIEGFLSIKDQKTSETVISRVFRKNELFSGPFAAKAPDLVLWGAKGYDLKGDITRQDVFGHPNSSGMSTYNDAFFYMRGLSSLNAKPAIRDIAPTVLKLLQIPVPGDMDGKSLI
jgi:predicted AlkP superfamily phosphohydrolase/phosphomutase